jgi:hypothetical protein
MNKILAFLAAAIFSTMAFAVDSPNPSLTPGAVRTTNPADICSTATNKITTKTVRNVPESLKKQVYLEYGLPGGNNTGYCNVKDGCEIDHLISLELGGSNDIKNLWPQPYTSEWNARMKDVLENKMHVLACLKVNPVPLPQLQKEISTDWKSAYTKYIKNTGPVVKHKKHVM